MNQRDIAALERQRKMIVIPGLAVLLAAQVLPVFAYVYHETPLGPYIMPAYMLVTALPVTIALAWHKRLSAQVIPVALRRMEARLGTHYEFLPKGGFDSNDLLRSGLVDIADKFRCHHRLNVTFPSGKQLALGNIETWRHRVTLTNRSGVESVDSGLFVMRKSPQSSPVSLVIRDRNPNTRKGVSGGALMKNSERLAEAQGGMQEVISVQPEFDAHYVLFASDTVRALRFLSPALVEKLVNLAKDSGRVTEFSVRGEHVYLFLNGGGLRASGGIFHTFTEHSLIQGTTQAIHEVLDIIDLIDDPARLQRAQAEVDHE